MNKYITILFVLSVFIIPKLTYAFCCPAVKTIHLTPSIEGRALKLHGKAEINQCYGLSFLHITLSGNVPDGTQFIPVFRSKQPVMGDWFTMTNQHGDTVMEAITLPSVIGKTLSITDASYTDLLTGRF
jgi:hypothetical protein